jgi:hypothetical protein
MSNWKLSNSIETFVNSATTEADFNSEHFAEFTGFFNASPGLDIDVYNQYTPGADFPALPFSGCALTISVYDYSLPYPSSLVATACYNPEAPYHWIAPFDSTSTTFTPQSGHTYYVEIYMNTQY